MYTISYKWFSMSPKTVYLQHFANGLDIWALFIKNWKLRFILFYVNCNGYMDIFYILMGLFAIPIRQFKSV